ncbi:oxidoreductase [Dichomitus squalens]|nr:oxidoreductase [Dichomitus squalens]
MLFSKKWDPRGKHCFITGGSSGTGLALGILLAQRGAHVSIVARDKTKLDGALKKLESARQDPTQVFKAYSFSVDSEVGSAAALKAAAEPHGGRCPDALFLCAGASRPGFFIEHTEQTLQEGMQVAYGAQAYTALAGTKEMVKQGVKGKIVFVSSVLGFFSFIGYSAYSPGKFALRGLAESLRSELLVYGIDVHIAFPATIFTPGLEEENKVKPEITLKIEETDAGKHPEEIAAGILKGVEKGTFHITTDILGHIFRASTAGASPRQNFLGDILLSLIGYIGIPIWRKTVDSQVIAYRAQHAEYLRSKGVPENLS